MADLFTLDDYKTFKGIDHFKDDGKISALVSPISELVKTYCGTSFIDYYSSALTEKFDIMDNQTTEVFVTESPLNTVTSVKERSGLGVAYETLTNNEDYYIDNKHDRIYRIDGDISPKAFPRGFAAVEVIYTAGYSELPQDLRLAVVDLIMYYHKNEQKQRQTIAGATIQNQTTSSARNSVAFPDHIKRVLDLYKVY